MDSTEKRPQRDIVTGAVFIGALLAFILLSFFTFMRDNDRRILEQNDSFIRAATEQKAERIDELLDLAQGSVEQMAHLYGSLLEQPQVDTNVLQDMVSRSMFDYVEFISADGTDLTADGQTADLSDRSYFLDGMAGRSGRCVVHNSRITNETLLIFYAPFEYDGRIIGVLSCILQEQTVMDILASDYFGMQGSAYLLERDGSVILSTNSELAGENLLDWLQQAGRLTAQDTEKLAAALDDTNDVDSSNFTYQGSSGAGSAYAIALAGGDWMLVQSFPSSLTRSMVRQAGSAGIRLEIELAVAFLIYVGYLLVKNWRQRSRLVDEKQQMSRIVEAVPALFTRFALVDFETDTYRYLENGRGRGGAPEQGAYTDLIARLDGQYIDTADAGEHMSVVIGREYVQAHLTPEVPYLQFAYQIDRDGPHWENMYILSLERKDGVPVQVLYAIQDVTALRERDMEIRLALKNASEAAEAANRAKSEFLARMSHDIRTPMNAIMGMTAVAAMHMDDPERLTDCLSKITISSRHLLALINDVLDMSKIESGKVTLSEEPFSMADMVESVVTIIRAQADAKRQQLRVHIDHIEHEDVVGDILRLQQIFVNILGNAVKFTPEEGTITFSIRESASRIHGMACYEFVCQDTGIGMDQAFIETIFEPFSRSKDSGSVEGTGLGMSITRNIVRMMDGDIRVQSQPGQGSTFTVQLHLRLQDLAAEDVGELAGLRVLVADDDETCCVAACEILQNIGMSPEWVSDGAQAVERTLAATQAGEDFAAVILDWRMPGMDGVETARRIRRQVGDHVPIIILSAYDWSDIEAEARQAGISAFIEKPLFCSRLVFALKSVLTPEGEKPALAPSALEEGGFSGKRVLLVEDNQLNREIAEELLAFIGVTVDEAEDGAQAVERFEQSAPGRYDLIFMDIQMPVMNGYDAARAIRALDRPDAGTVPIVAMTANAFADDILRAKESGMNDHVSKPVEVEKLMEMLKKWLR